MSNASKQLQAPIKVTRYDELPLFSLLATQNLVFHNTQKLCRITATKRCTRGISSLNSNLLNIVSSCAGSLGYGKVVMQ